MYIKLIFKKTIGYKQMYPLRLNKYRDSYVLYTTIQFLITHAHSFGTDTQT